MRNTPTQRKLYNLLKDLTHFSKENILYPNINVEETNNQLSKRITEKWIF